MSDTKEVKIYFKKRELSKGRLNRMCKYFRNKRVLISYEYNNSLDMHYTREYKGKYDDFVIEYNTYNNYDEFAIIRFYKKGKEVFQQNFDCFSYCEFVGVGKINILNSEPFCYFRIKKIGLLNII